MLTKVSAVECGQLGYDIRVNSVHPGIIRTELFEQSLPHMVEKGIFANEAEAEESYTKLHPIGRLGSTRDVGTGSLVPGFGCQCICNRRRIGSGRRLDRTVKFIRKSK